MFNKCMYAITCYLRDTFYSLSQWAEEVSESLYSASCKYREPIASDDKLSLLTKEALKVMHANMLWTQSINRNYDDELFHSNNDATLRVRVPNKYMGDTSSNV